MHSQSSETKLPFNFLVDIVRFAKEQGLSHVKCGDIEFTIAPSAQAPSTILANNATFKPSDLNAMPSDEDMLLWSAGGPLPSEERNALKQVANELRADKEEE